jgi:transcriptional regulator with XRE-family HTH domain
MASRWGARNAARDDRRDEAGDLSRLVVDEITWYMREHKVSRVDLAHSMNVSAGRVSQILSGEENLTLRTLSGVLVALGARVDFTLRPVDEQAEFLDAPEEPDEFDDGVESVRAAGPAVGRESGPAGRGRR